MGSAATGLPVARLVFHIVDPTHEFRAFAEDGQRVARGTVIAELEGRVVGWSALTPWSDRKAYDGTAETSFYVQADFRGRGIGKARELGFEVAIAVVDDAGHLIACDRMDGALWVTPEIARAKANAAAGFRASTLDLEERFTKRMLFADTVASLGDYAFVFG